MRAILNIAHRGASGHAPENTLAAFKHAIKMGADMIELDLHLSQDKELVVIHDRSILRTTGIKGTVGRLPLRTLKAQDAGSWFDDRYQTESIPTLQEVLDLVSDHVRLNIEIKKGLRAYRGIEKILLTCLSTYRLRPQPLISSFEEPILRRIRRLDADIPIGYLFRRGSPGRIVRAALGLKASSVQGPAKMISKKLIETARSNGLKVYVFTIDAEEIMRHFIDLGVDGIFTNYPDRLLNVLRNAGLRA